MQGEAGQHVGEMKQARTLEPYIGIPPAPYRSKQLSCQEVPPKFLQRSPSTF